MADSTAASANTKAFMCAVSWPLKRTRSSLSRIAIRILPKRLRTITSDTAITSAMASTSTKYMTRLASSPVMSRPSSVRKSVMPLAPPVSPCWPTTTTVSASDSPAQRVEWNPPPGQLLDAAPHHEVRQFGRRGFELEEHGHHVAAEAEEHALAQAQHAAVAPGQHHADRDERESQVLAHEVQPEGVERGRQHDGQ